jgi:hypothetical protein
MIEWGQVPAGMELLTTERAGARRFVLLHPEDGCANENLYGELSESTLDLSSLQGDGELGIFTLDDPPGKGGASWYEACANTKPGMRPANPFPGPPASG